MSACRTALIISNGRSWHGAVSPTAGDERPKLPRKAAGTAIISLQGPEPGVKLTD